MTGLRDDMRMRIFMISLDFLVYIVISMFRPVNIYSVAIVGAGVAGLAAANTLVDAGIKDIVILEAQNRPGGRIHTVKLEDGFLEMGAQWIHGKDNPIYELALKYNLIADKSVGEAQGIYVRNDGIIFDKILVNSINFEIEKILHECEKYVDAVDYPESVGHYLEDRFYHYLKCSNDDEDTIQMKLELYDWHVRFQTIDNSCIDIKRISAKQWGNYKTGHNRQAYISFQNGYNSLINKLINCLPEHTIILECKVNSIQYGNHIVLKCKNRSVFAKHVIITVSMGVLKQLLHNIYPPLPQTMQNCINNMGFYGIGKIFLIYDSKWWSGSEGFQLLWRKDIVLNDDQMWLKDITGFDEVISYPNTLLGWVGGNGLETMERLTEIQIANHCTNLLRKFLRNIYDSVPFPCKVIRLVKVNFIIICYFCLL